ncbi:uncharacterized protein LOC118455880 [Neolamprologus brichardi]|uniref:uncharacterized protein LOC118455880 n=1 Tax=Neolamprologus brichardi TaxID=32507 RepID=UPI001643E562|nr:uncharacterized protein LOC118455880 [Neolamprologus brichardi]
MSLRDGSGSFVVNVTQSSYQAEENHNITLEWTFTTKPDTSISALKIRCSLITDQKPSTLYFLLDGVEFSEDEEFSGRVQSDKDALREGRIRLQLSRLRTEDSGLYLCEVDTGYGRGYNSCRVTVSDPNFAKTSTIETSLQTPDPQDTTPANGRSRVPVVVTVIAFIIVIAVAGFCCQHQNRTSGWEFKPAATGRQSGPAEIIILTDNDSSKI